MCVSVHLKNTSTQDLRGRKCVRTRSSSVKVLLRGGGETEGENKKRERKRTELLIITLRGNAMIEAQNTWREEKKTERNHKMKHRLSSCSEKDF